MPRDTDLRFKLAQRRERRIIAMARVMVQRQAHNDFTERDWLLDRGFTPAEIDVLAEEARARAGRARESGTRLGAGEVCA